MISWSYSNIILFLKFIPEHCKIPLVRTAARRRKQKSIHRRTSMFWNCKQSSINILLLTRRFNFQRSPRNITRPICPKTKNSSVVHSFTWQFLPPGTLLHSNPLHITLIRLIHNKSPLIFRILRPLRENHPANWTANKLLNIAIPFHQIFIFGLVLPEK